MADTGFWIAWGIPARGRETHALGLLEKSLSGFLEELVRDGRIERYDTAILKPQPHELGGFVLLQGSRQQIDTLSRDADFQSWLNQIQLVADHVGIADAWVGDGIAEAMDRYRDALREAGLAE